MVLPPKPIHPKGEPKELSKQVAPASLEVDTFEGKIHVEWEPGASHAPKKIAQALAIQGSLQKISRI